jgi:argininosuccinate lyase
MALAAGSRTQVGGPVKKILAATLVSRQQSVNVGGTVSHPAQPPAGRLAGAKSESYVRAVNVPEARSSRFTARAMVLSDIAYVLSAAEAGFTPAPSARALLEALLSLLDELPRRDTTLPPGDIVAQREVWISEKVGREHTAWLHLGRNRGESLRCYLPRLFFRHALHEQRKLVANLLAVLIAKAQPVLDSLSPNYHHLQHSGFTTLGEYLLSWVEVFEPHLGRLAEVDRRLDKGPSWFGGRTEVNALYDRVSERLGFSTRARLRRDGIWVQAQFTEPFFAMSLIAVDLARLAQDMRVWMTPEFGLFEPADEHAGGSSALPHAKVPFALQSVIGGATLAATRLAGEMAASINPSEGSEPLYQSASLYGTADDILAWTKYMTDLIEKGRFDLDEMKRKATLDFAGSSEAHDRLVYDFGVPFRTGHRILGSLARSHHLGEPAPDLKAMLKTETGRDIAVDQNEIMDIMLGRRLWPTTFDLPTVREVWAGFDRRVADMQASLKSASPVEIAAEKLLADAKAWLAGPAGR